MIKKIFFSIVCVVIGNAIYHLWPWEFFWPGNWSNFDLILLMMLSAFSVAIAFMRKDKDKYHDRVWELSDRMNYLEQRIQKKRGRSF